MYFRANLTNIPSLLFLIAFVTNYHKSPPNLSYGFKARSPKHVSLGQSQGVNRAGSFWRFGEENPFPCPFQLWVAACILQIMAPSSIFKSQHSNLGLHHHITFSSSVARCPPPQPRFSLIRTLAVAFWAHWEDPG